MLTPLLYSACLKLLLYFLPSSLTPTFSYVPPPSPLGAGPTVMALTSGASGDIFTQRARERSDIQVANAMMAAAAEAGIKGRCIVTNIANEGAKVVKVEPAFSTVGGISWGDSL